MRIYTLDLRTRRVSAVTGSNGLWTARWSPDSRYIAALQLNAVSGPTSDEIKLYDVASRRWRTLTRVEDIIEPTWSQDGQYLYFESDGKSPVLYRVRVRDGNLKRMANMSGVARGDNWSGVAPDGSPLITAAKRLQEIYALRVEWP